MYRLAIPSDIWANLDGHLRRARPEEDGAFMLIGSGRTSSGLRVIAHELILPDSNSWEGSGRDHLRPSGQWLSAAIGAAIESGSGLLFVHSHPGEFHPPELSSIDQITSREWSGTLTPTLERPFCSIVWTPHGIDGWVFEPADPATPKKLERVQITGGGRSFEVGPPAWRGTSGDAGLDDRQVRALGELGNRSVRELDVAVVGAGGTGSPIAEQLVRMGIRRLLLVDPDRIDTASNLRRIVGSRPEDLTSQSLKVDVVRRHLESLGLDTEVSTVAGDVRSEVAVRRMLDMDVVISTTDTHSSRSLLNQCAHQYSIPLIDVGVKVGLGQEGRVSGMPSEVRLLLGDSPCLWCINVLDAGLIRAENLPADERENQAREGYVQGLGDPQPSLTPLNYFAGSLALLTLLRMLSSEGSISNRTIADGWEHYFADTEDQVDARCECGRWRAMGDEYPIAFAKSEIDAPSAVARTTKSSGRSLPAARRRAKNQRRNR